MVSSSVVFGSRVDEEKENGKLQYVVNFRNANESGQGDVLPCFDFDQSISSTNLATNLVDGHRTSNFCTPATQRTSLHEWKLVLYRNTVTGTWL